MTAKVHYNTNAYIQIVIYKPQTLTTIPRRNGGCYSPFTLQAKGVHPILYRLEEKVGDGREMLLCQQESDFKTSTSCHRSGGSP